MNDARKSSITKVKRTERTVKFNFKKVLGDKISFYKYSLNKK